MVTPFFYRERKRRREEGWEGGWEGGNGRRKGIRKVGGLEKKRGKKIVNVNGRNRGTLVIFRPCWVGPYYQLLLAAYHWWNY